MTASSYDELREDTALRLHAVLGDHPDTLRDADQVLTWAVAIRAASTLRGQAWCSYGLELLRLGRQGALDELAAVREEGPVMRRARSALLALRLPPESADPGWSKLNRVWGPLCREDRAEPPPTPRR